MEYTIVDMNSLKIKMVMILLAMGFIYALLYLIMTSLIPYNLTIRKQKDVFFRRVLFFTGIFTLFFAQLSFVGEKIIAGWRPQMNEDDMATIVSTLKSFLIPACVISLVVYLLTFWLSAKFLRSIFGYKPWTVFVSKGKKFGLF